MPRYWSWNSIQVKPDDLIGFAWSEPMRDLAAKVGLSDVGLRKLFHSHGIVTPPQGYWNKVRAGKKVPDTPKAPPRGPGDTGRCQVDKRLAPFIPEAPSMSSMGPFVSPLVPENLDELRASELQAIGKVRVPRSLDRVHSGLRTFLANEAKRRAMSEGNQWRWDGPKFDNPQDQRRLRILNGLLLALARRGHGGSVREDREDIEAYAIIGQTRVDFTLQIAGKHRAGARGAYRQPDPKLPVGTPLMLQIRTGSSNGQGESWQDDEADRLENKLAVIAASLIVAGEARFRTGLREAEERRERERQEHEERRRRRLEELNQQRLASLHKSGELLRQARDIRALVAAVDTAIEAGANMEGEAIEAWRQWALSEADKLDPVLSGQVFDHLHEPRLEQTDV